MPFSRISSAVRGRAVTVVTRRRSITSMRALSGVAYITTSPPETIRMFSRTCVPGTVRTGMLNGEFGRAVSSRGCAKLGPRSVARISASGAKGGTSPGSVGACRNVLTIVAKSFGTVCVAGSTRRPMP